MRHSSLPARLTALNTRLDQESTAGNCDYSNGSVHGGRGRDPVTGQSCPPHSVGPESSMPERAEPAVCINSDGDGPATWSSSRDT